MKVERNRQDGTGRERTYTHILKKGCDNLMRNKFGRCVLIILIALTVFISNTASVTSTKNYAQLMTGLVYEMCSYAKDINSRFEIVANGGYNLYIPKAKTKHKILKSVDGVIIEDALTHRDKKTMQLALREAIKYDKKALSIEYKSFKKKKGIVSYKAPYELDKIPKFKNKKVYDVNKLSDVKNFMVVLNTHKYKDEKKYLSALKNTDYDLIFIDLFYENGDIIKASDVRKLKVKNNGGKRLVYSYLSVGEAEDYRYYWKKKWNKNKPKWIVKENSEWEGNYKVRYWNTEWQSILYGYLSRIIRAGFDGVYLDVIDAYEYF